MSLSKHNYMFETLNYAKSIMMTQSKVAYVKISLT